MRIALVSFLGAVLSGCLGEANRPPTANAAGFTIAEDTVLRGKLTGSDPEGEPLTFSVAAVPSGGRVELHAVTGDFVYTPDPNYNGSDEFTFTVSDGTSASVAQPVILAVSPVNDAPEVEPLPNLRNLAETEQSFVPVVARDVDGDVLILTAASSDVSVAYVEADRSASQIVVTPRKRGEALVDVGVSDGTATTGQSFSFEVADMTKVRELSVSDPRTQAIRIWNPTNGAATFELRHNGARIEPTIETLLQTIDALEPSRAGEPSHERIWRYVRDSVYHWPPVTGGFWAHDPLLVINSIGFGFCDDVASIAVQVARATGQEARVWALDGHLVPEFLTPEGWQMFDPDLAVYYHRRDGSIAAVTDLEADSSLIQTPTNPVLVENPGSAYAQFVADIYATRTNNQVSHSNPQRQPPYLGAPISLPPAGSLEFPGNWSTRAIGFENGLSYRPPATAQLRLNLPPEFTGRVHLPLLLWDVQGSGTVRMADGGEYLAGSVEVRERLQALTRDEREIEVVSSSGVALIFLANPMLFSMREQNRVELTAFDVWRVQAELTELPSDERVDNASIESIAKPKR